MVQQRDRRAADGVGKGSPAVEDLGADCGIETKDWAGDGNWGSG